MHLHMPEVGILGRLFPLVGHVDQDVKPVTIYVTVDNCQPLLFVEIQEIANGDPELLQTPLMFRTARGARCHRVL